METPAPSTPKRFQRPSSSMGDRTELATYLTPYYNEKIASLKCKASDLSSNGPPTDSRSFVKWRISCIENHIEMSRLACIGLKEALDGGRIKFEDFDRLKRIASQEEIDLEIEKKMLITRGSFLLEDLTDGRLHAEEAYLLELNDLYRARSEEGQMPMAAEAKFRKAMLRDRFKKKVVKYLANRRKVGVPAEDDVQALCAISGVWFDVAKTRCAHIVPKCFETKNLAYLFGTQDAALSSARNGLIMHKTVEKAFDNNWIAIVPNGSLDETPTRWKTVLINTKVENDQAFTVPETRRIWRWKDLDNRPLTFLNDNRPARRYLYFRYIMAYMTAKLMGLGEDTRENIPRGPIWAAPQKGGGYLRRSVLQALARRVGDDDIPEDILKWGTFEDTSPSSSNEVQEEATKIEVAHQMEERLNIKHKYESEDEEVEG